MPAARDIDARPLAFHSASRPPLVCLATALLLLICVSLFLQRPSLATPPIDSDGGDSRAQSTNVVGNGARTPGAPKQGQGSIASINTATGNKLTTIPLTGWACRGGMSVGFSLFHNSRGDLNEPLAAKWRYSYESYVVVDGSGNATLHWDDGSAETFTASGTSFTSPAGEHGTLSIRHSVDPRFGDTYNSGYLYTSPSQVVYAFDSSHGNCLVSITDRNLNAITITRQTASPWNVTSLVDPTSRQLNIYWNGEQLSYMTDPMGRRWNFGFYNFQSLADDNGTATNCMLSSVTLPAVDLNDGQGSQTRQISFYYTSGRTANKVNANITQIEDPRVLITSYAYNDPSVQNALTDVTDAAGNHASILYNNFQVTSTEPNGHQATQFYTSGALLDHVVDPTDVTTGKYTWDANFNLNYFTDGRSLTTTYYYTATTGQNFIGVRTPDNALTQINYTSINDPQTFTDPLGHTRTIDYTSGNASGVVDGNHNFWPITVPSGSYGLPSSVEDPFQNTTSFQYDGNGNVNYTQDANGIQHWYTYNTLNWLMSDADVYGNTTAYNYDSWGRLIQVRKGGSSQVPLYRLDGAPGCLDGGNCSDALNRMYTADPSFQGILANGAWITDGAIGYVYMNPAAQPGLAALHRVRNSSGAVAGQQVYTADANPNDPNSMLNYYTSNGFTDQGIVCYVFTAQNAQGSLLPIYWAWNSGTGRYIYTNDYGEYTNLASQWQGRGVLCWIQSQSGSLVTTATYGYDADGNVVAAFDGNNNGVTMTYDADNRLLTRTNTRGHSGGGGQNDTVTYTYDQPHPLTGVSEKGLLTQIVNGNNGRTFFTYDADSRVTDVNHPDGTWDHYQYDADSNVTWHEDGNGAVTLFTYDNENRLVQTQHPSNGPKGNGPLFATTVNFGYDAAGRMTSSNDLLGQTNYSYDNANQLTSLNTPTGQVNYGYYANGQLHTKTVYGNGGNSVGTWTYTYHGLNQTVSGTLPSSVVNPYGETTSFGYDSAGRVIGTTLGNNQVIVHNYDDQSRVSSIQYLGADGSQTPFAEFDYTYDAGGRIISKLRGADNHVSAYSYDGANQLTQYAESYRDGTPVVTETFAYDRNGNRIQRNWDGVVDTFSYDAADKLLSVSGGILGSRTYSYDSAGQATGYSVNGQQATEYDFDYDGHMLDAGLYTNGNLSLLDSYRYNAFGLQVARQDSTGNYSNINDGVGPGSPVITDGTSVFSDGISMHSGGVSTYFAGDLLGSIEDISSGSGGSATHVIEYDPFGVVTAGYQSSLPSVYGYAAAGGAQTSPDTDLILMGNRWYDPQIGRFLSPDPSGAGDNPYAYCGNNPVSSLDPLGLDPGNVNPSPSSGDSQDLSGLFQAGASWVGKELSYLGRQLFGSGTGDFHTSQFAQNAVSALRYHFGNTSSTFDHYLSAPTYGLPYLSILQGDPYGEFLTQAVPIAGQAALALATDGASAEEELLTFFHGTDTESALSLLNGVGLSEGAATAGKIDGAFGFFMADNLEDAMFFGNRRPGGTVIEITMRPNAFSALQGAGGVLRPIPIGTSAAPFNGNEFFLPPSTFARFNAYYNKGYINIGPASF